MTVRWPFACALEQLFPTMFSCRFDHGVLVVSLVWHTDQYGRLVDFDPTDHDPEGEHSSPEFYADDGAVVGSLNLGGEDRPCPACGLVPAWPGDPPPESSEAEWTDSEDEECRITPDPCLGWLRGVRSACCGHGRPGFYSRSSGWVRDDAFVLLAGGSLLRGDAAITELRRLGGRPPTSREGRA